MSVDTTIAVLYAQSGLSNNANAAMVAPQAALAMTRVLLTEQTRQERERVKKSEQTEKPDIQTDRDGRRGFFSSRLNARRQETAKTDELPLAKTPTLGNLLNMRI